MAVSCRTVVGVVTCTRPEVLEADRGIERPEFRRVLVGEVTGGANLATAEWRGLGCAGLSFPSEESGGGVASESRLYTFSQETKDHLRKFRLGTSRSNEPQAVIYYIDKNTHEIRQDDDKVVYKSLEEVSDDLPDHSPRFVLLSYPLTLPSGRLSVPYVLIYYLPITCNNEIRMLYAGAKELMRNTSEVGRVIDIQDVEDLEEIPQKLGSA
ncbi:actin-depolymerizing factor gmf1 [Colletotrichum spaethianum]|uniref:Actin-depolymerizing factor gmf1 n=1 Tax=Colletotrichum spaethianum TaxID=700344 RepID=A0AA37LC44_9PEZI|nr:actin-depolymerizing factor gmf1 [Colletotrichum spaethianum]GKT45767.1 actin-depolymerizing factor gmf1 [Colletotrichum spaethianum]